MANRKVLINRHTSGSSAPQADSMYLGEIAVAHETGKETLFTKNNAGNMVPFISCAQTISIIDDKIKAVDVVYEVKKGENEPHIEVTKNGEGTSAVTFVLTSNDIQSETEFEAYSARTNNALTALTKSFADLLDVTLTGGSGDDIITVSTASTDVSANTFSVTHKAATAVTGFNKLSTDGYGHVTAATPVATADIQALGFKTSAETGEEIAELSGATVYEFNSAFTAINTLSGDTEAAIEAAIQALDSATAVTAGKYMTGIAIADGKISGITEADLPELDVEAVGSGNVVASITVNDHKITYQTASVATSEGIAELSGAVISLSAATTAISEDLNTLSGATESISGYAHDEIAQLSGATVAGFNSAFTAIQAMDKAADAVAGQVVTTVSEVDGVVSETKANVKDLQLGGYVKDTTATGDIAGTDTINTALSKLENKANAITIDNADGSINVTTGANGTDINVNIKSGEHVLAKDGSAGLYTNIKLSGVTPSSDLVKEEFVLYGTDNTVLGDHIKIYKDQSLVSITLEDNDGSGHTGQYLKYTYIDASGDTQSTYVNVSSLLVESEFKSGVTADASGVVHGVVDPTSESFLTVGADGFKLSGVQDAIDAKVNALDVTGDTAVAGQYVAAIEQTDGVVAVKTRANVSEAVLNNYAKGTDGSAVAATDSVREAIGKLENQIDAAKAAATTKVVEGTDAGNNMTITPSTGADGSVTYTVDLADVASATALTAEIAARKAVDGQNGDTYAANANTNFITGATSLNDADVKLDAAIKALSGDTDAAIKALDSSTATTDSGHYLTAITITDGKISAIGQEELPAATPVTTVNSTTGSTASPVLVGIATGGTEGHQLTLTYTNMVESAKTSESADTAAALTGNITSGQVSDIVAGIENTKVHEAESADTADSAEKVANALSISGYASSESASLDSAVNYDGSAAQSITFGKPTAAGKSMSFSSGVVDVEIIDCGEY